MSSNEIQIIQNLRKRFFKSIKSENFIEIEKLLILKTLPKLKNTYQLTKLIEKSEDNNMKLLYTLLLTNSENSKKKITYFEKSLELMNTNEILKNDEYEFYYFFSDFFFNLKYEIKNQKLESDLEIEKILSNLRKTFGILKRNEYWKSILSILNILFFLYFKINQFHQSTYLFNMIEKNLETIKKMGKNSEKLKFHFYISRLYHFKGEFEKVEQNLKKAFFFSKSKKNKKKILRFLIPTKINLCILPTNDLLLKYNLKEFSNLKKSILQGNLKLYNLTIKKNKLNWIKSGVFFLLGESKSILYRNLLKRIYLFNDKKNFVDFEIVLNAFNLDRKRLLSKSAVVGIVSGLIFKDFVRGYVLIEKNLLFFKKNPFPELF